MFSMVLSGLLLKMVLFEGVLIVLGLTLCSGLPTAERVIAKLDPVRYQYMSVDGTTHLVDTWVKTSDLEASARYSPEANNGYHLFTRANRQVSQPIPFGVGGTLLSSNFDPRKKTVVLVHGWMNNPQSDFNVHLTYAYLAAADVNVFMTDWSVGAGADYVTAVLNNVRSGEHVAQFISWVNSVTGANLNNYHIIGHSLGAHQAGVIGRRLNGRVPYITALDAAMPGWITNPNRFTPDVGLYTEVMHTDSGLQGFLNPIGDVDFYPNGGRGMPGCNSSHCDHHQCIFYMAESLMSGGFTGRRCSTLADALADSCTGSNTLRMGGTTPKTGSTGIYHMTTNAHSPFSRG